MPKIKRSKRGQVPPKVSIEDEGDLAAQERDLQKQIRELQKVASDKKGKKEFETRFEELEKKHQRALRNGSIDYDFEGFLDKHIIETKKRLAQLRVDLELRQGETFRTIVPAGARPVDKTRCVALVVTLQELKRLIRALDLSEQRLAIGSPGYRPTINDLDDASAKGDLSAFLLRCALESGIGWATSVASIAHDEGCPIESF